MAQHLAADQLHMQEPTCSSKPSMGKVRAAASRLGSPPVRSLSLAAAHSSIATSRSSSCCLRSVGGSALQRWRTCRWKGAGEMSFNEAIIKAALSGRQLAAARCKQMAAVQLQMCR